jgi:iron complex outermembrane recepter protein
MLSSAFLEQQLSKKTRLNVDMNYLLFQNDNPATINSLFLDKNAQETTISGDIFTNGNRSESLSKIKIGILKADLNFKLNPKTTLETGLKGSISTNTNKSKIERLLNEVWVLDNRSQSTLSGNEDIIAAYSTINATLNPKTTLNAGLRYEYWVRAFNINGEQNKYSQFFPTVHLNYKISESSAVAFSANRRINRPAYNDLVSNLFYNDPTSVFTGNPLLKPSISNTFKSEINYKGMNFGLTLQNEENPIIRYQLSSNAAKEILILSPQNLDYQNSISINTNLPLLPFDWWTLNLGNFSSFRKYKVLHTPKIVAKTYFFHNFYLNQTLKMPACA